MFFTFYSRDLSCLLSDLSLKSIFLDAFINGHGFLIFDSFMIVDRNSFLSVDFVCVLLLNLLISSCNIFVDSSYFYIEDHTIYK